MTADPPASDALSALSDPVTILARLAARPTAPFHETRIAREIVAICRQAGAAGIPLTWQADRYGNLLVWYRGGGVRAATPIAFGAHMDHPGLEVVDTAPLTGLLLGGVPRSCFDRPVPVRLIHAEEGAAETAARITGHVEREGQTMLSLEADGPVPAGSFGVFDVGPFREVDGRLYQPAADDLAGCAAILSALVRCARRRVAVDVAGVFTRCEEVGLVGASLVARQRLLPPQTVVVSLEASRALPGAAIGDGPVIRVGDRTMAFHPTGEALLRRAGARLLEQDETARVQRQLMSGGTCEAVSYALAGYITTGVAFPLGNYHNAGPDDTITAEVIDRSDLEWGAALLVAAAECAAAGAVPEPAAERLARRTSAYAPRLEQSARTWSLR